MSRLRPKWSRTVRFRLAVRYAALFLAAGSVLVVVTYALLDHSLSTGPTQGPTETQVALARKLCESAQFSKEGSGPINKSAIEKCVNAYTAGIGAGKATQRSDTLDNLLTYSLIVLACLTLGSGGLGWAMAGRVLQPVRTITGAARRASEENLSERVGLAGPEDELKELADTFDSMLDRLDEAFTNQRAFIANASHELRTPLTAMRTAIDVTLAKPNRTPAQLEAMAMRVRDAVDQSEALIDSLLLLARSERGVGSVEFVDLATACEDALDLVAPRVKDRDLKVTVTLHPAELTGDRLLLERMVGNLVDNASRYSNEGGWLRVSSGRDPENVFVEVANSGDELPADIVPLLTEPFRRIDVRVNRMEGAGLGLAIVKAVSEMHGGTLALRGLPGGGLEAVIQLPIREPSWSQ